MASITISKELLKDLQKEQAKKILADEDKPTYDQIIKEWQKSKRETKKQKQNA